MREGDAVAAGQVIAEVFDPKLVLQLAALDARLESLAAQRRQAAIELDRVRQLRATGAATQARLDDAQTALDVLDGQVAAARAEREVLVEQQREGQVLAPQAGQVLSVRGTVGAVVQPGEPVAVIATGPLRAAPAPAGTPRPLPARRRCRSRWGRAGWPSGRMPPWAAVASALVYPRLDAGQVVADAEVEGLGDFFVGERVRVTIAADRRPAIVIPASSSSPGRGWIWCASLPGRWCRCSAARPAASAARRGGNPLGPAPGRCAGAAMTLGISGHIARGFIRSPLTPLILLASVALGLLALFALPREEEPQISVPMVSVEVRADGLSAPDAMELVTRPLEAILMAIPGWSTSIPRRWTTG